MKVSSQILLPGDLGTSPSQSGNTSDNGEFAGLVSANSPQAQESQPSARQSQAPQSATSARDTAQSGGSANNSLADDRGGSLESEQSEAVIVRAADEARSQLARANSALARLEQERLPIADDLPQDGKGLPVAVDPALVPDVDTAEGEAGAEVIALLADIDLALVAPAATTAPGQPAASVVVDAPGEGASALANGDDAAAAGDKAEAPAMPSPLRSDGAPRPAELDQLRGGRAQGLAWEQAQQTILAPARQPANDTAQPSLGAVALAPEAGKDLREGASTAQLLAGAGDGEKSDLKSLKELREARLAAAPAVAAKAASAEPATSQLADTSFANRGGAAPLHPTGAAPSGPTDTSLAQLVDRLIETRVAARSERSHIELSHPDFGRVTLAVGLRGDDRLSVDLPGAPTELRNAVGQALAQTGAAQGSGQNAGQNSGSNGNQTSGQRAEAQGQSALAGGENSQNSAGNNGGSGKNTYEPENPQLSIFTQSQAAGSDSGASRSAGGPASGNRRGVLA